MVVRPAPAQDACFGAAWTGVASRLALGELSPARLAAVALYGATLTIAVSSVLIRRSYSLGGTPEAVIVFRTGVPAVLLGVLVMVDAARRRLRAHLSRGIVLRLLALGGCLLGGSMGELHSLARLQTPIAILFFALAPFWIAVISRLLYGTRLGRRRALALVVSIVGVVIVVGLPSRGVDPIGCLFAAGGGLSASGSFLLLEGKLAQVPLRLVWAVALGLAALTCLVLHPSAPREVGRSGSLLRDVLAAGALAGLAQLLATVGVRAVGAVVAGIATALEPVNAAIVAWIVLGETVGVGAMIGGIVALAGVVLAFTAGPPSRRQTPALDTYASGATTG
jgi:drug/metabolite transporter (DMT)-like permease